MLISAVIKGIIMVPMVMLMGIAGAVISSVICFSYIIFYSLNQMTKAYGVRFRSTLKLLVQTSICLLATSLVIWLLSLMGCGATTGSNLTMCVSGIVACIVFFGMSLYFRIPQHLFHIRFKRPARRV